MLQILLAFCRKSAVRVCLQTGNADTYGSVNMSCANRLPICRQIANRLLTGKFHIIETYLS